MKYGIVNVESQQIILSGFVTERAAKRMLKKIMQFPEEWEVKATELKAGSQFNEETQ